MHDFTNIDLMLNGAAPKWQNTGISAVFHCIMKIKYNLIRKGLKSLCFNTF